MCTIAILLDVVAGAPLVVAANRDELYARPTRPPERLGDRSRGDRIAGCVDVLSGGTWLAIHRDGRFAAVTNQRVALPPSPGLRSRGLAVLELAAAADQEAYVAALDPARYASMNLAWGGARGVSIAYLRHHRADGSPGGSIEIERLSRGIHVLCNDRLGAEGFPRGARLHDAIAAAPLRWPALVAPLIAALGDHTHAEPPPALGSSRLSPELVRATTATCIHATGYGTRSSSILAARDGETLAYLHADGPPCTAPFVDRMALL